MNKFWRFVLLLLCISLLQSVSAQNKISRRHLLHGALSPMRNCYDVKHYDIALKVIPDQKRIVGANRIGLLAVQNFNRLQIDFSYKMGIDSIKLGNAVCTYLRDSDAVWVQMPLKVESGTFTYLTIYFSGIPVAAKKAPWDGGFVWSSDSSGKPWIGLACEGIGASVWLPCKDHWSDEADSVDMHLEVPQGLTGVSNGRWVRTEENSSPGFNRFHWQVRNPINNYSITVNIGDYVYIRDSMLHDEGKAMLELNYFVLKGNEEKAATHFQQVKTMIQAFEYYFGTYPFASDGYKLVEAPFWGMEHQSCVAYGNNYQNNPFNFDFIIIHESGHEWFANSITADDPAEMWIHESFTTYSEALYVEYMQGKARSQHYLNQQKEKIVNKEPMMGPRDVYFHDRHDNDIYYKGTWMLHTMRSMLNNDSLWFAALKGFAVRHQKKIINTTDVLNYFNEATGRSWDAFFKQYLHESKIPVLEYKVSGQADGNLVIRYRWRQVVKGFEMPVWVTMTKGKWDMIVPQKDWQLLDLNYFDEKDFKINMETGLFEVKKLVP
ncbi:MAG: M1 family metallopeptidase [Bacteroidia bacterium]